jgi:uncharacterized membrane protein
MLHCTKCGAAVDAAAPFCQVCGARQPVGAAVPDIGAQAAQTGATPAMTEGTPAGSAPAPGQAAGGAGVQSSLTENAAAALSYSLLWITGIIFLIIDKRPFVQFHAAQSLVLFGALWIVRQVVGAAFGISMVFGDWGGWRRGFWPAFGPGLTLLGLLSLATFVLWLLLMLKAYQGENFRIPVVAEVADTFLGKKAPGAQL